MRSRDRANPLDMQVSEIRHLIHKLHRREEPKSPLTERSRSAAPRAAALAPPSRTRGRSASSGPRRARPGEVAVALSAQGAPGPSSVESRLLPICERLEGVLERIETRLQTAPAPAGELPPLSPECVLRGRITDQLLPDLLQLVTSNRWTGVFVLTEGPLECRLYFDDGQACHAEAQGTTGEGAFFVALAMEQGEYSFLETAAPTEKTISSNTQFLILEALRQIDEAKGG